MTAFRVLSASIAAAVTATSLLATPAAFAQDYWSMSCGDLWYRRNSIYAENGYCFKTDRALRVFGNANCRFYVEADVPLSRDERAEIDMIRSIEARKGC
ncbi:YARHG domain-containing protein [Rhodomicrobium sp. Az07]|uniref:YARHG domain-containing protein n=1 Tax=Rhodomicrobium sp. Az07 TaxID=2839034 RepID=UPI001BE55CA5|nr:YARHG domain-containing protein [Rhodomicrobium sp. Az07]MBT3069421.1 YARHG domain-containing protein [Rhodomicrobium sp. Az07]